MSFVGQKEIATRVVLIPLVWQEAHRHDEIWISRKEFQWGDVPLRVSISLTYSKGWQYADLHASDEGRKKKKKGVKNGDRKEGRGGRGEILVRIMNLNPLRRKETDYVGWKRKTNGIRNRGDPLSSWREYINESTNVSRIQFEDFPRIRHARMHGLQLNQEEKGMALRSEKYTKYVSLASYFFVFKFEFISLAYW